MQLPRFVATTPAQGTGLTRARDIGALTATGPGSGAGLVKVGEALQEGSKTLFDARKNRQKLDDELQWGKATEKTGDIFQEKLAEIETLDITQVLPDPNQPDFDKQLVTNSRVKRDKDLQDAMHDVDKRLSKVDKGFSDQHTGARFAQQISEQRGDLEAGISQVLNKKLDNYQRAEMTRLIDESVRSGNMEQANRLIKVLDDTGLVSHAKAIKMRQDAVDLNEQQHILLEINFAASTLLPDDIQDASDAIENSTVFTTEAEKATMRNQLKSVLNNARLVEVRRQKQLNDENTKELTDLMVNNTLTTTEVNNRREGLSATSYTAWSKMALTTPKTESNLPALVVVKDAVLDIGLGRKNKDEALKVLYANTSKLSRTDWLDSFNKINSAELKSVSSDIRMARDYLEEQIRTKDTLTGLFSDNFSEQTLSARMSLLLDEAIKQGDKEGKTLTGAQIMNKAHELALSARNDLKGFREVEDEDVPKSLQGETIVVDNVTDADIDEAVLEAESRLGPDATKEEISAEVLIILGYAR